MCSSEMNSACAIIYSFRAKKQTLQCSCKQTGIKSWYCYPPPRPVLSFGQGWRDGDGCFMATGLCIQFILVNNPWMNVQTDPPYWKITTLLFKYFFSFKIASFSKEIIGKCHLNRLRWSEDWTSLFQEPYPKADRQRRWFWSVQKINNLKWVLIHHLQLS